tara:strand:- start:125 stop:1801 length:1677 start_codon:yes stop_codon:yes gene_type:complete
MKTFINVAQMKLATLQAGQTISWGGYYTNGDGGGNSGIVRAGAHTDDGGSVFTLANGNYIEANLKGASINALKFGVKVNDNTFDSLATLNNLNAYAKGASTNERRTIKLPSGGLAISNTFTLIRELIYQGMGAKVSIFYPFSGWDNTSPKFLLEDELLDSPNNTPDNNFFGIRRDFGTRNDQAVSNIGCMWARPGGGSEYTNLYLADAYLEDTLLVSGDGGGASVAASFNNIWLATTGANPGTGTSNSRAKNGLSCNNCFSITFKNIVVDYQTNDTDYTDPTNDTNGFGVKLVNSQVVFINPNMEGNAKPFYVSSAQHSVIYGGSIYRQGLGAQTPNADPDFIFRAASENSMPSILNVFASLGYGESNGGGVATTIGQNAPYLIKTSADLATVNGGGFSYFNANSLNIRSLDSVDTIATPLELEVGTGAIFQSPISRLYRSVYRNEHSQVYQVGSGNVIIPLAGYGRLLITATRNDSSNSNRGQVIDALYSGELVADGSVAVTAQLDESNAAFNVITGLTIVDDGGGGSALNVAYTAGSFPFLLNVIFEGRTSKNITK